LDLLARTLLSAAALIENGGIDKFVEQRYAKWDGELGKKIHAPGASLASISDAAVAGNINPKPQSGPRRCSRTWSTGSSDSRAAPAAANRNSCRRAAARRLDRMGRGPPT